MDYVELTLQRHSDRSVAAQRLVEHVTRLAEAMDLDESETLEVFEYLAIAFKSEVMPRHRRLSRAATKKRLGAGR